MMVPAALALTSGSLSDSRRTKTGRTFSSHTRCFPSIGTLIEAERKKARQIKRWREKERKRIYHEEEVI